jgi:hypothetical protein
VPTETPNCVAASRVVQKDFSTAVVDMVGEFLAAGLTGTNNNHILLIFNKFCYFKMKGVAFLFDRIQQSGAV